MKTLSIVLGIWVSILSASCASGQKPEHSLAFRDGENPLRIWSFSRVMVEGRPQYARVQISESAELVYENGGRITIAGNAVRLDGGPAMELHGNWIYDAATKTMKPGFIRTFE